MRGFVGEIVHACRYGVEYFWWILRKEQRYDGDLGSD